MKRNRLPLLNERRPAAVRNHAAPPPAVWIHDVDLFGSTASIGTERDLLLEFWDGNKADSAFTMLTLPLNVSELVNCLGPTEFSAASAETVTRIGVPRGAA